MNGIAAARLSPGGRCFVYFWRPPPYCSEDNRTWTSSLPTEVISTASLFRKSELSPSSIRKARVMVCPAGTQDSDQDILVPLVLDHQRGVRQLGNGAEHLPPVPLCHALLRPHLRLPLADGCLHGLQTVQGQQVAEGVIL